MPINHTVTVLSDGTLIRNLIFDYDKEDKPDKISTLAAEQLREYFVGERREFSFPYSIDGIGTEFFRSIMYAIEKIPYGERVTYKQLAFMAQSKGVRAAASALKKNPLPIIIPCHRIVPADMSVGRYMAGTLDDVKAFLLELEKRNTLCQ